MSYLIVTIYEDPEEAGKVREAISKQEKGGYIKLDDSAVVVKDAEGKVHVKNEMDRGTQVGMLGGGFLGLLIAGIFFPIGGLIIGGALGALVGKLANKGVDQKFVKEVEQEMAPNSSALFIISREDDPGQVIATLQNFKGKLLQTSLDSEAEEALRKGMASK